MTQLPVNVFTAVPSL